MYTTDAHAYCRKKEKIVICTCLLLRHLTHRPERSGYKNLSYRRDSARRRSLRRSRSFKITDVSTNRKPVCDFLLTLTCILSRPVFQLSRSIGQIIAFDKADIIIDL